LTKYRNYGVGTSANQPKPPDAGTLTHVSELLSSLGLSMIRR
jgi:hypothetical protein